LSTRNSIPPEERFIAFIRRHRLISGGEKIVVAVSGGPDSVCLLYILAGLRDKLGISLHVAHLDHRLRGADSAADARYVARLARRLEIPATIESRDVRSYQAEHRLSPEEAAREVRYTFLGEVAAAVGADRVAVGHTADDHVETVLMHLLRGSGTQGLRGLLPATRWKAGGFDFTVIRPLLEMTRAETNAYCRRHRLSPRSDVSNLSSGPFRNKIRLHLLPELKKYNPRISEALLRTARIAADDLDYIEGQALRQKDRVVRQEEGSVVFDKKEFLALPPALKRNLLRHAIEKLLGNLMDIESGHIEDIVNALAKPAGKTISLPEGLGFTIEHDRYVLARDPAALCPFPATEKEVELRVPGQTSIPGGNIEASVISPPEKIALPENGLTACFDYEKTGDRLTVRCRRPGDRFRPLGMLIDKKLNEFMIDTRVPRAWRDRVPIVSSPGQIIWVVGYRIDERVKVTVETRRVLIIRFVNS
jgi:tRNA(Ile)-lysidine synthase